MSWCYGLMKSKGYKVIEVYDLSVNRKKINGYVDLSWYQYFTDFFMIIKDLFSQRKHMKRMWKEKDFK